MNSRTPSMFSNRTIGFYLGLAAGVMAIVSLVAYAMYAVAAGSYNVWVIAPLVLVVLAQAATIPLTMTGDCRNAGDRHDRMVCVRHGMHVYVRRPFHESEHVRRPEPVRSGHDGDRADRSHRADAHGVVVHA